MPKTLYVKSEGFCTSGVDVAYTKSRMALSIGGWYDSHVGIESREYTLREFFDALGITAKDCAKAFVEVE